MEVFQKRFHCAAFRFFFGKNKVMSLALGRSRSDEYRPGLRKIARRVQGQTGLLFTNASEQQVLRWGLLLFLFYCLILFDGFSYNYFLHLHLFFVTYTFLRLYLLTFWEESVTSICFMCGTHCQLGTCIYYNEAWYKGCACQLVWRLQWSRVFTRWQQSNTNSLCCQWGSPGFYSRHGTAVEKARSSYLSWKRSVRPPS